MDAGRNKRSNLKGRSIGELITLIEQFELTLEYIAAAADVYSSDDLAGRRFAGIRNTAQEMINEFREIDPPRTGEANISDCVAA